MKFLIRCFSVLLVLGILLPGTGLILPAAAESLYIRKIVSVVYDDSTSMQNFDRWANANYAMQAFSGLLGMDDRLFLTYMSEVVQNPRWKPEAIDLSAEKINESLAAIRGRGEGQSTPYTAVETAFEKLKSVPDNNENTQYWLVVITDGMFNEGYTTKDLDKLFKKMTGTVMPNGTKPQITFLSIGDLKDYTPTEDVNAGIYTYSADTSGEIPGVMSDMADRVSGKTKIDRSRIQPVDDRTVRVSSELPLLSIALLAQKTEARVTEVRVNGEVQVPIVREADLMYPGYADLIGGAFLIGDSQSVIAAGSYDITFDRPVRAEDLTILYEPALELRMVLTVNGQVTDEFFDWSTLKENDVVSVSCAVCEMGTGTEIPPERLPPDTAFSLKVIENGQTVWTSSDSGMELTSYGLKSVPTEICASVTFSGFRPIETFEEFHPAEPAALITVDGEFRNGENHVRYSSIGDNQDVQAEFTIYADGTPVTDPAEVRALNPKITVSPDGNGGDVTISPEGKVVYTPKTAGLASDGEEYFEVVVTCTAEGKEASLTYRVVLADYEFTADPVTGSVAVTEFYGNTEGVSFHIYKDGAVLTKADVLNSFDVTLNEEYAHLAVDITIASDGTITCVPNDPSEYVLTFGSWWLNWLRYFRLERADVNVHFDHPAGSADAVLPVTEASLRYQILCVYAPLLTEVLFAALVTAYLIRYFTKARFSENAILCVGNLLYSGRAGNHSMDLTAYSLNRYNTFRNLWNPFRELSVMVGGVRITALHGGQIRCEEPFPWYSSSVRPADTTLQLSTAEHILEYFEGGRENLRVQEILPQHVIDDMENALVQDDRMFYIVDAEVQHVRTLGGVTREAITSGTILCYTTR